MKICTVALFLGLVAAAYSSCVNKRSVVVGPTVTISTKVSSVVGETICNADNPSLMVVNAEPYSPTVSSRYIIVSIEIGCDGSRTLRAIDSLTGFVVCLPIFYDSRVGLEVVVVPLTGEFVYFIPKNGCCTGGFTFYFIYLDTCSGTVYLLEVLTGNVYQAQIGCYGDVKLIPVSVLPDGVIQLKRQVRVDLITVYGVQRLFITDLYSQATYTYSLYEISSSGLLITSDFVVGLDYVLKITDCGTISLQRSYVTLGGALLTKTVDSTFVRVSRSSSSIDYVTVDTAVGVMPYVKATTTLRGSVVEVSTGYSLEISNVNTGVVNTYTLTVGPKNLNFVADTQGNQFFVYTVDGRVTLYSVYKCGELYYVVNPNSKQIQLLDISSSGTPVFYNADTVGIIGSPSLTLFRRKYSYRIVMSNNVRSIVIEEVSSGYSFKTALRMVNNLFVYRDDLTQIDLLVIDTDVDLPTVQECWITPKGIMVIDPRTLRLCYVTLNQDQFVYTDVELGTTQVTQVDSDFLYFMRSGCASAVC